MPSYSQRQALKDSGSISGVQWVAIDIRNRGWHLRSDCEGGDVALGGEDFDTMIVDICMQDFKRKNRGKVMDKMLVAIEFFLSPP